MKTIFALALAAGGVALSFGGAAAATLKTLYSFCAPSSCNDGFELVQYGPILGIDGNLYGVTYGGGAHKGGMIYALVPNEDRSQWTFKDLHDFGGAEGEGARPRSGLILDADGNLYGTAATGGAHGSGQAFKLSKKGAGWKYASIHDFCIDEACSDGRSPLSSLTYAGAASGLPYDGTSPLYGIAIGPASGSDARVAFSLTPSGKAWREKLIHGFGSDQFPFQGTFMVGADGSLYDARTTGRAFAFRLVPNARGTKWKLKDLHRIGSDPNGDQIADATGAIFGTTQTGTWGNGNVYRLDPETKSYQVMHEFCALADCTDGKYVAGGVKLTPSGDFIGFTTTGGGHNIDLTGQGGGTVYRIHDGALDTVYAFCAQSNCSDGEYPVSSPTIGTDGNIFGATQDGGANGGGTVFEIVP